MTVDITKKYRTRDGRSVRILATDLKNPAFTVAAAIREDNHPTLKEVPYVFTAEGRFHTNPINTCPRDLIEVSPYEDFRVGDPVMGKAHEANPYWNRRYFAGVSDGGQPMVFTDGTTQWSSRGSRHCYAVVRRPTSEELA